jgi:hypothetical protein
MEEEKEILEMRSKEPTEAVLEKIIEEQVQEKREHVADAIAEQEQAIKRVKNKRRKR